MQINFNDKGNIKESEFMGGGYEAMLKMRQKKLPEIQATIQDVFSNYTGGLVAIIVMKEDENGLPDGSQVFMGGVSRPEMQLAMGKALYYASDEAVNLLLEAAKKDPKQLLNLTKQLIDFMGGEK